MAFSHQFPSTVLGKLHLTFPLVTVECGVWSLCVHVACLQFSPMDGYFGQYTQTGGCFEQVVVQCTGLVQLEQQ